MTIWRKYEVPKNISIFSKMNSSQNKEVSSCLELPIYRRIFRESGDFLYLLLPSGDIFKWGKSFDIRNLILFGYIPSIGISDLGDFSHSRMWILLSLWRIMIFDSLVLVHQRYFRRVKYQKSKQSANGWDKERVSLRKFWTSENTYLSQYFGNFSGLLTYI
jgi:hypothetical protein